MIHELSIFLKRPKAILIGPDDFNLVRHDQGLEFVKVPQRCLVMVEDDGYSFLDVGPPDESNV